VIESAAGVTGLCEVFGEKHSLNCELLFFVGVC